MWTLSGVKRGQGEVSNYKQTANTESLNFWVYMRCSSLFKLLVEYLQYLVPQNTWWKCNVLIPFWRAGGATVLGRQPHGVRGRDRHRRDSVFLHNAHHVSSVSFFAISPFLTSVTIDLDKSYRWYRAFRKKFLKNLVVLIRLIVLWATIVVCVCKSLEGVVSNRVFHRIARNAVDSDTGVKLMTHTSVNDAFIVCVYRTAFIVSVKPWHIRP